VWEAKTWWYSTGKLKRNIIYKNYWNAVSALFYCFAGSATEACIHLCACRVAERGMAAHRLLAAVLFVAWAFPPACLHAAEDAGRPGAGRPACFRRPAVPVARGPVCAGGLRLRGGRGSAAAPGSYDGRDGRGAMEPQTAWLNAAGASGIDNSEAAVGVHQSMPEELDALVERDRAREVEEQRKLLEREIELENSELPPGFAAEADETESRLASIITHSAFPESNDDGDDGQFDRTLRSPRTPENPPGAGCPEQGEGAVDDTQPPTFTIRPWSPAELGSTPLPGSGDFPSDPYLVEQQKLKGAGSEIKEGEWTLKTALLNASVHGSRLLLLPGHHGPFHTLHSYPEEHDAGRIWADPLAMYCPCHIIGGGGIGEGGGGEGGFGGSSSIGYGQGQGEAEGEGVGSGRMAARHAWRRR